MIFQVIVTIMAGVGAETAYATEIVAVQRVMYHMHYNFGCGFAFAWLIYLFAQPAYSPMDACHVHPVDRFFNRRDRPSVSCFTPIYE